MTRKNVRPVPEGYGTLTPYVVTSDAGRMITFLEQAFGATLGHVTRIGGAVCHAEMKVGTSMLMLGQPREPKKAMPAMYYIYVEDCDALYAKALAAGATSLAAPTDQPYGDRNGGVEDFDGNQWYIGTHVEDLSDAELDARMSQMA